VDPGKGQHEIADAGKPQSPAALVLQRPPPKTNESGPLFDFSRPEVAAAEASLRESARGLEAGVQGLLEGSTEEAAYRSALAAVEALLPDLYARYDAYLKAVLDTGERATCARGCSHCCSHYVTSVEPFELIFLHGRIRSLPEYPNRLVTLYRRAALFHSLLEKEKAAPGGDPAGEAEDKALYRYYLRGQPCPFLSASGACGVYSMRPISCRMFFSQSDPALCRGKAVTSPGNRNFIVELPDDIEASLARAGRAFARFDFPESLFGGLLKANEAFGRFDEPAPPT
jgi:Fe-S-cluster containining protein